MHLAGNQIDHARRDALVRHVDQLDRRHRIQQLTGKVADSTRPGTRIEHLARFGLCQRDEVFHIFHRQRRMHNDRGRNIDHQPQRREILDRVERQFFDQRRVNDKTRGNNRRSATIRRALSGDIGTDGAARARPVIEHHLLPEQLAHTPGEQPEDDVAVATRRRRIDDADDLARKRLRRGNARKTNRTRHQYQRSSPSVLQE